MTTAVTTTTTAIIPATQLHHLHGPKPTPLMINKNSSKIVKKNNTSHQSYKHLIRGKGYKSPVIVYLKSPKVIHVLPHEFMTTVQRLTGKSVTSSSHQNL
ncbi:hypothetical protein L2E82_05483 [Cichorium intybus]|uniref:Uncharacterized protein n=1 Tax=Cichorium intybus TaxID=13427 RepID=A0ACB9H779_CICIN|nr:hypothetical protein L2E82_05483 [Cichorium intybus]